MLFMMSPGIILFLAIIHLYIDWFGLIKYLCGFTKKRKNRPIDENTKMYRKQSKNEQLKGTYVWDVKNYSFNKMNRIFKSISDLN